MIGRSTREEIANVLYGTGIEPKDIQQLLGIDFNSNALGNRRAISPESAFTLGDDWLREPGVNQELIIARIGRIIDLEGQDARILSVVGESMLPGVPVRRKVAVSARYSLGMHMIDTSRARKQYGTLSQVIVPGQEPFLPLVATWEGSQKRLSGAQQPNFQLQDIRLFDRGDDDQFRKDQITLKQEIAKRKMAHDKGERLLEPTNLILTTQDLTALMRPGEAGLSTIFLPIFGQDGMFHEDGRIRTRKVDFPYGTLGLGTTGYREGRHMAELHLALDERRMVHSPFRVVLPVETRPTATR